MKYLQQNRRSVTLWHKKSKAMPILHQKTLMLLHDADGVQTGMCRRPLLMRLLQSFQRWSQLLFAPSYGTVPYSVYCTGCILVVSHWVAFHTAAFPTLIQTLLILRGPHQTSGGISGFGAPLPFSSCANDHIWYIYSILTHQASFSVLWAYRQYLGLIFTAVQTSGVPKILTEWINTICT